MESRRLLSATSALPTQYASPAYVDLTPAFDTANPADGGGAIAPFTPAEIRHFYGLDAVTLAGGVVGDGSGQTIGIVDAYSQPDLLDSTDPNFVNSDLHNFDVLYGLPDPPSFIKVTERGKTTNLPTTYDSGWAIETSLDVEWAHAMAPEANIVLVECASSSYDDLITEGAATAGNMASVVSMSFVGNEFDGDSEYDSVFASHTGVTYLAAAGDQGSSSTGYPAFSPDVVAVGGTQITTSDANGSYGSEQVWNDQYGATGGGVSDIDAKPSYQATVTIDDTQRVVPDVSFDGAPSTGVEVYDSSESTTNHMYQVGGTSLSSPCWAGIIAIANQDRSLLGLTPLTGATQTLPRLYQLAATDFNDITVGYNFGYFAGVGYDACTGLGTPIAPKLIPDLAGGATIGGRAFQDNNSDGIFDGTDKALANQTVYLDIGDTGVFNANDPTTTTDSNGFYSFTDQVGGAAVIVRPVNNVKGYVLVPTGATPMTSPGAVQTVTTPLFPTVFSNNTIPTSYTAGLDSTATTLQISVNGAVYYSAPVSLASSLTFLLAGAADSLTVNGINGSPVPAGGISLTGVTGGNPLTVIGTASGNDVFTVTSSSIAFGSNPITFTNVSSLFLNPGAGTDSLAVNSGSLTIQPQTPGRGILTRQFSSIALGANASTIFATAASHSDRTLVVSASLSVAAGATLDLGGNDMVVQNGDIAAISALLSTGYNNGFWTGVGLASAAAANDTTHLTALGAIANTTSIFGPANLFDGVAPAATDILIKFTYYGDANLDGQVDGSDYTRIDYGYLAQLTGWGNGDFNYDSVIDGSDYTLIDNAFNSQTSPQ